MGFVALHESGSGTLSPSTAAQQHGPLSWGTTDVLNASMPCPNMTPSETLVAPRGCGAAFALGRMSFGERWIPPRAAALDRSADADPLGGISKSALVVPHHTIRGEEIFNAVGRTKPASRGEFAGRVRKFSRHSQDESCASMYLHMRIGLASSPHGPLG